MDDVQARHRHQHNGERQAEAKPSQGSAYGRAAVSHVRRVDGIQIAKHGQKEGAAGDKG